LVIRKSESSLLLNRRGNLRLQSVLIFAASLTLVISMAGRKHLEAQTAEINPLQLSPHHATAEVADIDKETNWYESVLGFKEIQRFKTGPDYELRQMGIPGYRIDLLWQRGSVRPSAGKSVPNQGWLHVVFKSPIIDAVYKVLVDKGTDVKAFRNAQPSTAITRLTLHDPEGNEVEILPQ
jgi:catechol 2,3-dioxygenase-like lactoylglutathione lyase family enzyme